MDGNGRIDELEQKFNENPRRFFAPLANEYRKAGNVDKAIAICRAHLGQLPGHMSGQIVYGQALFENGEYDEARTVFENALAMDRENLIALRHLGDLALRSGDTALAKQWYSKLLDVDPKDATVIALVSEVDSAREAEESAAASHPVAGIDEDRGDQQIPQIQPEAMSQPIPEQDAEPEESEAGAPVPQAFVTETMAELYLRQGFHDRALDVFRQLSAARPEDDRLRARVAELDIPEADRASSEPEQSSAQAEAARADEVMARREEAPSVEAPGTSPEEHVTPSIETPSAPEPAEQSPSEESPGTESTPIDSPPSTEPGESESVESPIGDDPRAEPEGIAAATEPEGVAAAAEPEEMVSPPAPTITVREFFLALGRRRPRAAAGNGSNNGHSSVETFPLGAPSPEDEREARVLSAAFSSGGEQLSAPRETAAVAERSQAGKESEEDVASFRAWLDGLTGT